MSSEGAPQNRRAWSRLDVDLGARLRLASEKIVDGRLENLGRGGAFFVTDNLETSILAADPVELIVVHASVETRIRGTVLRLETFFSGTDVLRTLAIRFDEPLPDDVPVESA